MLSTTELETAILNLPFTERQKLTLTAWASLESSPEFDPEGIEIALKRNEEIESGISTPISYAEFNRLTQK